MRVEVIRISRREVEAVELRNGSLKGIRESRAVDMAQFRCEVGHIEVDGQESKTVEKLRRNSPSLAFQVRQNLCPIDGRDVRLSPRHL